MTVGDRPRKHRIGGCRNYLSDHSIVSKYVSGHDWFVWGRSIAASQLGHQRQETAISLALAYTECGDMIKASIKRAKSITLFCVDTLLTLTRKAATHPERVLVIRVDAIGDFVLWIDAARAIV